MAEFLLSYTADQILQKVQSVVTDTIAGAWGLKDDLQKLSDSMGRLQSLWRKVQYVPAVENDESIKDWLQKLQDAVYAAADVMDEFQYEILRRKVEDKNTLKRKLSDFVSRNNLSAQVREVSKSLADVEKGALLLLLTITVPAITVATQRGVDLESKSDRMTDSFLYERPIGRTEEAERIIKMLQVSSSEQLTVISIVGFGGLGKTTLAQLVFEQAKIKKLFDVMMWVCVSEPFDIQKILGEMLQKLDSTTGGLTNMDVIVDKLQQQLIDKRFLLVLDDVWNEEFKKWDNLRRRLGIICKKNDNFVVTTTRSRNVADIMGTRHMVELKQLSVTECWAIIKQRIDVNEGISHDMGTIGMEIAKKCRGVPLVAKVVAGVLRSLKNKDEWLSIQRSNIWNEVDEGEISGVLKLSFDHLPPPQKLCFAYCSLFPKDFLFSKAQLIQLWMAEDFLKTNGGTSAELMEDVGEEYFHSLLVNSFFQDAQVDDCGNIIRCKMHDLLHDLALSISKSQRLQCGSDCIETSNGRRLNFSCYQKSKVEEILEKSEDKTRLRSLFSRVDVSVMLSNFKRLRSLDMSDAKLKNLPREIGELKHLRYLDISKNETIRVLPESITKLYHLQTLKVFKCKSLKELPSKIINLVSLRHIGFDDKRLMPSKVGGLTNLQTLPFFVVGLEEGQMINELEGLKELRGELVVCNLENVRDKGEAERAKMKEKKLSKLVLQWMEVEENEVENFCSSREGKHEEVMEGIEAPTNTQSLTVEWYMDKQFPKWMSELRKLVNLTLKNCRRCVTMPTLGHLRNLKILRVERMDSMIAIGGEFYGESNNVETLFPLLEKFTITKMKSLVEWVAPKGTKIFPKLRYLWIEDCPNLTSFPLSQSTSSAISMRLDSSLRDGGARVEILCFMDFKSLKGIWIQRCPKLTFLHTGLTSLMDFRLSSEYYTSWQQGDWVKNLSVRSNELGESLKMMKIEGAIEIIREFPKSLEVLKIDKLGHKLSVDAFHGLSFLETLVISNCDSLESISTLSSLTSLKYLQLIYCSSLESIPTLSSLPSLKHLDISGCDCLESIPTLSSLTSLEHLKISRCGRLESIPTLSSLTSLKHLEISGCGRLESIPTLSSLTSLEHLEISGCGRLESIPTPGEIKLCTSLEELTVAYCRRKVSIDDDVLGSLTQLKTLQWGGFSQELDQLPGLNSIHLLTSLQKLKIIGWEKLTSLPHQLQHLTSITHLEIWYFDGVESLPDWFCKLSSLQSLSIYCCKNLKNLTIGMQSLTKLRGLEIWRCPLLKERCTKDTRPEWSNISHIPLIRIDSECTQDVRRGTNAEISS